MSKFLNTSATNYYLEELIKSASERLILISPFLRLNDRVKELLEDKNRLKIDVRIVYGKNELHPDEIAWLKELTYVRTSFCKNLHAKCYLNEESAIITSLNLYEFSQVNNNEMGIAFNRSDDQELYRDAFEEAQRIIRISDEVRMSLEKVTPVQSSETKVQSSATDETDTGTSQDKGQFSKLSSSRIAKQLNMKTADFMEKVVALGYLELKGDKHWITQKAKDTGVEFKTGRHGAYFLWPLDFKCE